MEPFPERPVPPRSVAERARDWIDWFGVARLAVAVVSIAVIGGGGFWLLRSPPPTTEAQLPFAGTATSLDSLAPATVSTVAAAETMVVHVAGAVLSPGVHRLQPGARVVDAVSAAGGLAQDADVDSINLAAPLRDGDRVYVPHVGRAVPVVVGPSAVGIGAVSSGPVNLNAATAEQLDTLPGVGPATAAAILAHRDQFGPFASIEGLLDVPGIGESKFEALRNRVTV